MTMTIREGANIHSAHLEAGPTQEEPGRDFRRLPDRIDAAALVTTHDLEPAPDPTMGRDAERDFMLRYAG